MTRRAFSATLVVFMTSDRELLQRWRDGDAAAGEELFERHHADVLRFLRRLVYDTQALDDLLQETFLACRTAKNPFRGEDSAFRYYLLGIARNKFREYLRKRTRGERLVDPNADAAEVAEVTVEELGVDDPAAFVELNEEKKLLLKAMRRIPVDYQLVLHLVFWEELTMPQLAELLGVPVGTASSRLRLGKQRVLTSITEISTDRTLIESTRTSFMRWYDDISDQASKLIGRLEAAEETEDPGEE